MSMMSIRELERVRRAADLYELSASLWLRYMS